MLATLQNRLLIAFLAISLIALGLLGLSVYAQRRVRNLERINGRIEKAYQVQTLDYQYISRFINRDRISTDFFQTNYSSYISQHHQALDSVRRIVAEVQQNHILRSPQMFDSLTHLSLLIYQYRLAGDQLVSLVIERGFKDYGVEGQMRDYAHKLEVMYPGTGVLMLRRHEKDFIIRKDSTYISQFRRVAQQQRQVWASAPEALALLTQYETAFQRLAALEFQIGVSGQGGKLLEIETREEEIGRIFTGLILHIRQETDLLIRQINLAMWFMGGFFLAMILLVSLFFSRRITFPVVLLSAEIAAFIRQGFRTSRSQAIPPNLTREVKELFENFYLMQDRIGQYIEDLTRQKEIANQANAAKSKFLANISHEIRTPLNGALGIARLMRDTHPTDTQQEYLDILDVSNQNLLNVINDILDFSKIEAGFLEIKEVPYDLHAEIVKSCRLFASRARLRELAFEWSIDASLPAHVMGDPMRLAQILNNLINNAIKFTEKGAVKVRALYEPEANSLYLEVADTGIGIAPEDQQRLFLPFVQLDTSATRPYGGTGLGLSICHQLVQAMSGQIGVISTLGEGSLFWVRIPLKPVSAPRSAPQDPKDQRQETFLRILMVEDNVINQRVAGKMLTNMGHQVTLAENGAVAVEKVKSQAFDLILMDLQMPVKDGLQAAREIRLLEQAQGGHTPIIALTANHTEEDRIASAEAGMVGFLTKPITQQELRQAIEAVVSHEVR